MTRLVKVALLVGVCSLMQLGSCIVNTGNGIAIPAVKALNPFHFLSGLLST